ncbi:DedA family protein, putative [hydrothermal vent metagenome]|uniref:DedA family protein, putative n=1 Tax=hydrothermal vent metagenome TaxID=652676 RepID=A0A3B0Z605_9ZZZZ
MFNKKILLFLVIITAILCAVLFRDSLDASALDQWVKNAGGAGPALFIFLYMVATVLFLPGSIITLAGGALFGPFWGTLYNTVGATIGATAAFLITRYLTSAWVEKKLESNAEGRISKIIQGVDNEGWRFVAFVRLVPIFPFNVINYAMGLTNIKVAHYVLTSFICMLPGTFAYSYLGYAAREAVAGQGDVQSIIQTGIIATAILTIVAYLPRFIKKLRK